MAVSTGEKKRKPTAKAVAEAKAKAKAEATAKIAAERKEVEERAKAEEAEKLARWEAGYRKYKVIHPLVSKMKHPEQLITITTEPTEVKFDSWIECQLDAKLIAEV